MQEPQTTSNVLESSYIDNSERALGASVGQDPWYIKRMRERDPDVYKEIKRQGHGQFVLGHIRYIEEVNDLLFHWGELYNILEDAKLKPYKNFFAHEDFRTVYNNAFNSKEKAIKYRAFINLKKMLSSMTKMAIEADLLKEYDLEEEYRKYSVC